MQMDRIWLVGFSTAGTIALAAAAFSWKYANEYAPEKRFSAVCAKAIQARLKSPDTYRQDSVSFSKFISSNGTISYSGIIIYSSQNGFGALIQNDARCEFNISRDESTFLDSPKENYPKQYDIKLDGKSEIDLAHEISEKYRAREALTKLMSQLP